MECIAPLPYIYDAEDERVKAILARVATTCNVKLASEEDKEGQDPSSLWPKVWQVIRYISDVACWTDSNDDTMITQCRIQQSTAKRLCACSARCCNCDEDIIIIPLEYAPIPDNPMVSGTISVMINGKLVKEEMIAEYLNERLDPYTGKLYISRDDFPEMLYNHNRCCCLCKRELTITLRYNAGYDTIPAGMLPIICPIISKINEAGISTSDCAAALSSVAGLLKRAKSGSVEYEWATSGQSATATSSLAASIYNLSMMAEIQSISRCEQISLPTSFGDVI